MFNFIKKVFRSTGEILGFVEPKGLEFDDSNFNVVGADVSLNGEKIENRQNTIVPNFDKPISFEEYQRRKEVIENSLRNKFKDKDRNWILSYINNNNPNNKDFILILKKLEKDKREKGNYDIEIDNAIRKILAKNSENPEILSAIIKDKYDPEEDGEYIIDEDVIDIALENENIPSKDIKYVEEVREELKLLNGLNDNYLELIKCLEKAPNNKELLDCRKSLENYMSSFKVLVRDLVRKKIEGKEDYGMIEESKVKTLEVLKQKNEEVKNLITRYSGGVRRTVQPTKLKVDAPSPKPKDGPSLSSPKPKPEPKAEPSLSSPKPKPEPKAEPSLSSPKVERVTNSGSKEKPNQKPIIIRTTDVSSPKVGSVNKSANKGNVKRQNIPPKPKDGPSLSSPKPKPEPKAEPSLSSPKVERVTNSDSKEKPIIIRTTTPITIPYPNDSSFPEAGRPCDDGNKGPSR